MSNAFTNMTGALAVVSPCSQCKNQLSEQVDGKPFCPRRKAQADLQEYEDNNQGNQDQRLAPLAAYGTEGTSSDGDQSLRNPVYLDQQKTTLVWIATLRDNSGVPGPDGTLIAPSILDPTFLTDHTEYIQCRPRPFLPAEHEAHYRQVGGLKEMDFIEARQFSGQQTTDVPDPIEGYQMLLVDGTVSKVSLMNNTPRTAVELDYNIQGA